MTTPCNTNGSPVSLPPPDEWTSWLEYAIDAMDTRSLFLQHCCGEMIAWKDLPDVQRSDMRAAATEELRRLRGGV